MFVAWQAEKFLRRPRERERERERDGRRAPPRGDYSSASAAAVTKSA